VRTDGPAHHAATEQIQNRDQECGTVLGVEVGRLRNPDAVGIIDVELPVRNVVGDDVRRGLGSPLVGVDREAERRAKVIARISSSRHEPWP